MKTTAVICEFNPLHTGHKRLIDFARTFSDKVVCIMSGNFVQRGMPAVANKTKRATHAILAGADLVVELPTVFATASAENFAFGGVSAANALGADFLLFGCECGNVEQLQNCANLLDSPETNERIRNHLKKGVSYPKAVSLATRTNLLEKPNNVLAVEYLRALSKTKSKIQPVALLREDNFNDAPQQLASSSALRKDKSLFEKYSFLFVQADADVAVEAKYCEFATSFLATATAEYLENIEGVSEGLHNRIVKAEKTQGFEKMMEQLKTKRYTRAKLQRVVLNCVLGITKADAVAAKTQNFPLKVLAVKRTETQLLDNPALTTDLCRNPLTQRADSLYSTFDGCPQVEKLLKI